MNGGAPDPAVSTGARFAMVLPVTWQLIDLDPDTRDRSIQRMLNQVLPGDRLARIRHEAVVAYRRMVEDATDSGAFLAATLSEVLNGSVLAASLLAFLVPLPLADGGAVIRDAEQVAAALADPGPGDEISEHSVVTLPVGPAARIRARVASGMHASDGREPVVDVLRFFVPVPELDLMLVIAFSTPNLALSDGFADLFDALAGTARWLPEGG